MFDLFEPEELVGKKWHLLVRDQSSYAHHAEAAVRLDDIKDMISIFFRAIGGDPGIDVASVSETSQSHRLSWRMRLGMDQERLAIAKRDNDSLLLPRQIDYFPEKHLNRSLYLWLAAFLAHAKDGASDQYDIRPENPLHGDLLYIARAWQTTTEVIEKYPGLGKKYAEICTALAQARPTRRLPTYEARLEKIIQELLFTTGPAHAEAAALMQMVLKGEKLPDFPKIPRGYKGFLSVPLWGEVDVAHSDVMEPGDYVEEDKSGASPYKDLRDGRKHTGVREENDQVDKEDPLALNRFEKVISLAEMVNVNRGVDDDEDEDVQSAVDDLDEMSLTRNKRTVASTIKLDISVAGQGIDSGQVVAEHSYPEWDYRLQAYRQNFCAVFAARAEEEAEGWTPDEATRRRIKRIQRQFEALRPKRERVYGQQDGKDLDIDAMIRSACDLKATGEGSDRIYIDYRNQTRDLAAAILADVSLSTDSWLDGRRVLDVEKEALMALALGLKASGDDNAIYCFSSRKRHNVRVDCLKDFDEEMSVHVQNRISALKPGYYTRMGAALRHVTQELLERPNHHRLLLLISDGKPNDMDHYEGRYGIEDTRMAIREARAQGVAVFGVTVDEKARDYFPYLFGPGGGAIIPHIENLPAALPAIFRNLLA